MADNGDDSLVQWGHYRLPSFLFYYSAKKSTFISPAAPFNPAGALKGQGWQSAISPSSTPKPKTLILTVSIYQLTNTRAEWLALIHWFQRRRFELYFWVEDINGKRHLMPCPSQLEVATSYYDQQLDSLSIFQEADFKCLADEYQLPRQQVYVFNQLDLKTIFNCLNAARCRYIKNDEIYDISAFMTLKPRRFISIDEDVLEHEDYLKQIQLERSPQCLDTIHGIKKLFRMLIAYPELAESLVKQYSHFFDTSDKIFSCIGACSSLSQETVDLLLGNLINNIDSEQSSFGAIASRPELLARVAKSLFRFREKINDVYLIRLMVIHQPSQAKTLMDEKWELIIKTAPIEACFVKAYPERANELFSHFCSRVEKVYDLAKLIKAYPDNAQTLLADQSYLIKSQDNLSDLMEACKPLAMELLHQYPHFVPVSLFSPLSSQVAHFLMQDETRITNHKLLCLCLKYYPQEAERLLGDHFHLLKSINDVWDCYDQINQLELQIFLLGVGLYDEDEARIRTRSFLVISGHPTLAAWLFNESEFAPHFSSHSENDCRTIHRRCPEFLDWSLSHFYPHNYQKKSQELRRAQIALDRSPLEDIVVYKDYLTTYKRYRDWKTFPLKWTETIPYGDTTYLYLANLEHSQGLFTAIEHNQLRELVVVEITHLPEANLPRFGELLELLKAHCRYVRKVIIPAEAKHWVAHQGEHFPFCFELDGFTNFGKPRGSTPNRLYIAQNDLASELSDNLETSTFVMAATGSLLNAHGQVLQRVRTRLIELSSDYHSQTIFIPQHFQPIATYHHLDDIKLNALKTRLDSRNYYHFVQAVKAGEKTRLLSIDAQEHLFGVLNPPVEQFILERGEDDFLYVTAAQDSQFSYVIEADSFEAQVQFYAAIPPYHPLRLIIEDCKSSPHYHPLNQTAIPSLTNWDRRSRWFDELYRLRAGACRHRCYAVWYHMLRKHPDLKGQFRLVDIDNNHMRLEIFAGERWHQVDLGGSAGELTYLQPNTDSPPSPLTARLQTIMQKGAIPKETTQQNQQIREILFAHKQPQPLLNDNLATELFFSNASTVLLLHDDVDSQAAVILTQARLLNLPLFYIDKPDTYGRYEPQLRLNGLSGEAIVIRRTDDLDDFLQQSASYDYALLMVNWTAFSAQEALQLNTLLDRKKSVYGKPLASTVKVISLCNREPADLAFLSRHQRYFFSQLSLSPSSLSSATAETFTIDVQGYDDWLAYLFGPIVLKGNNLVWEQGPLTKGLASSQRAISIKNLSATAKQAFDKRLRKARAEGFFRYHGYAIQLAETQTIHLEQEGFDFSPFEVALCQDVTTANLPRDYALINGILFDYLLTRNHVYQGRYDVKAGLIKDAQGKTLVLFINGELPASQWYCLCKEADNLQVTLELYLAPGVNIPEGLRVKPLDKPSSRKYRLPCQLIVSNQPEVLVSEWQTQGKTLCFAIEDYSYQDIVEGIDYHYREEQGFYGFALKESPILKALKKGQAVILYGQLNEELLAALAPLLLRPEAKQLQLIIEEPLLTTEKKEAYPPLAWLSPEHYRYDYRAPVSAKASIIYQENSLPLEAIDLSCSANEAQVFIDQRKKALLQALVDHTLIQLIGPTAVGKTYLIEELKKMEASTLTVFHELHQFDDWARDKSEKIKLLFIDEVNIDDRHYTLFSPMKEKTSATLLYKGKLYPLTDKHRVVFARNPHHYGGGRMPQKLFADHRIPELHYEAMPAAFIYERLLKPIYQNWQLTDETRFKSKMVKLITCFLQGNQAEQAVSVRQLQEWALAYAASQQWQEKGRVVAPELKHHSQSQHFIPIPSTEDLRQQLSYFLLIRQMRRHQGYPGNEGLNGFLIEGKPGMGKSELIRATLKRHGYQKAQVGQPQSGFVYYKLDASLPLEQKKGALIRAFEEGQGVWLDEINSCLDDGLEKILNSLLSGFHPETGKSAKQPGFVLLLTANSMGMDGRSLIGPALRARLYQAAMPPLTIIDFTLLLNQRLSASILQEANVEEMAEALYQQFKQHPELNLRQLMPKLETIAGLFYKRSTGALSLKKGREELKSLTKKT